MLYYCYQIFENIKKSLYLKKHTKKKEKKTHHLSKEKSSKTVHLKLLFCRAKFSKSQIKGHTSHKTKTKNNSKLNVKHKSPLKYILNLSCIEVSAGQQLK